MFASTTFFFSKNTATTEIYTLSLHDALPISMAGGVTPTSYLRRVQLVRALPSSERERAGRARSEEHTSELQSHSDLVCRLLLEKKNRNGNPVKLVLTASTRMHSVSIWRKYNR